VRKCMSDVSLMVQVAQKIGKRPARQCEGRPEPET
jgi:hypothetical protein